MKLIICISIFLLFVSGIIAQPSASAHRHVYPFSGSFKNGQAGRYTLPAGRITSSDTASRCLAEVDYAYSPTLSYYIVDSEYFFYSGSEIWSPGDFYTDPNNQSGTSWANFNKWPDSVYIYYYDTLAHAYTSTEKAIYTRTTTPNQMFTLSQALVGGSWNNSSREFNLFNALDNETLDSLQIWDSTSASWVNSSRTTYSYSAANKWDSIKSYNWDTTWHYDYYINYVYNPSSKVVADYYDGVSSGAWYYPRKDSLFYNSSGTLTKQIDFYHTAGWYRSNLDSFVYTGGNMELDIDSIWSLVSGSFKWANNYIDSASFNAYNQPSYDFYIKAWNTSTWNPYYSYGYSKYYYELFADNISSVTSSNGSANLYPVPAESRINLEIKWDAAQNFNIVITDITGKAVYLKNVASCQTYNEAIQLAGFAKGTYILRIDGEKGNIVKKFTIDGI